MADSPLIIKLKEFALQIIKVCNDVKQTKIVFLLVYNLFTINTKQFIFFMEEVYERTQLERRYHSEY